MYAKITALGMVSALICSCSIHQGSPNAYNQDPLCTRIEQRLDRGAVTNNTPSHTTVNMADRARLLKQYNYLGCHEHSDNRYVMPHQSLEINKKINHLPATPANSK